MLKLLIVFLGVLRDLLLILYFSKKCGILNVGSRVYEITCNITKKKDEWQLVLFLAYFLFLLLSQ